MSTPATQWTHGTSFPAFRSGSGPLLLIWRLAVFILGTLAVPIWILSLLLLISSETEEARLTSLAILLGLPGCVLGLAIPFALAKHRTLLFSMVLFLASVFAITRSFQLSPDGTTPPDSRLQSISLLEPSFRRYSIANLVPELDQVKLGSYILPAFDRYVDWQQASRVRGQFLDIYRELRQDHAFVAVGSHMHWTYRQVLGKTWDKGLCYLYLPEGEGRAPYPVVLLLHGFGGNLKANLWVMKPLADANQAAVVAPDFGMGRWQEPSAAAAVQRTLLFIRRHPALDETRVVLVGQSNGALGVTRAAMLMPSSFRALIYVSPILEADKVGRLGKRAVQHDMPIHIIHGEADRRVPIEWLEPSVDVLRHLGAKVAFVRIPEGDHFLFFSRAPQLIEALDAGLKESFGPRQTHL